MGHAPDIQLDVRKGVHRIGDPGVNWYLVEDGDGITVVDAGVPASWGSLTAVLERIGATRERVRAVVLTHGHFDHVGFAARARRELGVPLWAPVGDADLLRHPLRYPHERSRAPYMLPWRGLPAMTAMTRAGALRTPPVDPDDAVLYDDGDVLDVPGRPVAVATPGHTPGHTSLHLPDRDAVIAGDAIVTFDPYTRREGPRIVARAATADSRTALQSLDRIAATGAGCLLPGHGLPWSGDPREAVAAARAAPVG